MNAFTRALVRRRARDRCEYCRLPQSAVPFAPFHVEHVIAQQHGGGNDEANLGLACDRCNLHKGTNLASIDPLTNQVVLLFNPRSESWAEHFAATNFEIFGKTPTGRATVRLLNMNAPNRVQLRADLELDLSLD